jgi:hypothetical protein
MYYINDYYPISCTTHSSSGLLNADSLPTFRIYEEITETLIQSGFVQRFDSANTTGFYKSRVQLLEATGYEVNKGYTVLINATVGGVSGSKEESFKIDKTTESGVVLALNVSLPNSGIITTNSPYDKFNKLATVAEIATGIDENSTDINTIVSGVTALRTGVTVTTNSDKTGYSLSVTPPTAVQIRAEIDSNSTQLSAIVADTNELQTAWASGGSLQLVLMAISGVAVKFGFDGSNYVNAIIKSQDNIDFGALQKTSLNNSTPTVIVSDKTGYSLSIAGNSGIVDALWNKVIDRTKTFGQTMKTLRAILSGKSTAPLPGSAGTQIFYGEDGITPQVTAPMDANGGRPSGVTEAD